MAGAIITRGNEVLIARRPYGDKVGAGKWEFPGGKIEPGEHPDACIVREIREELDCEVEVEKFFDLTSHVYGDGAHIVLLFYLCRVVSGTPRGVESPEIKWVKKSELTQIPGLAEADRDVAKRLASER